MRVRRRSLYTLVFAAAVLVAGTIPSRAFPIPDYWQLSQVAPSISEFFAVNDNADAAGVAVDSATNSAFPLISYGGQPAHGVDSFGMGGAFYDINASGVAVGTVSDASGVTHAYMYDHGMRVDYGPNTSTRGINDSGVIAINRGDFALLASPNGTELELARGTYSKAEVLNVANDRGAVGAVFPAANIEAPKPAVWTPSGLLGLLPLPPGYSAGYAFFINPGDTRAAGIVEAVPGSDPVGVVWDSNTVEFLPTVPGRASIPQGINDDNVIVGLQVDLAGSQPSTSVLWNGNQTIDIAQRSTPQSTSDGPQMFALSNNYTMAGTSAQTLTGTIAKPQTGMLARVTTRGLKLPVVPPVQLDIPIKGTPLHGMLEVFGPHKLITLPTVTLP
jgi:hypothetical protein